ncbi:MAG TPA: FAD-binding oxidoreductase [Chloroflexia bacterium]|nr:FAD-binding oxidoreductase [Chloroflexia bacterium]
MATRMLDAEEVAGQAGISEVRPAFEADAVLGVVPSVVATPGSVEEVSRVLAWANGRGLKVVPCGARTKLDRGNPPTGCDILLQMGNLSRIVEHAAGDMTVTTQAGVQLEGLQGALAGAGQFLAIDPPVPGTVGGLVATGDSGPRRLRYGGVRDLILGVTFVRADGVVAKGGGKVVKNVAGYDLPKLLTGSLGTLGVIVEATFRLYPVPSTSATVVSRGMPVNDAGKVAAAILNSTLVPTSIDYHSDKAEGMLAVRFGGSPGSVEAQAEGVAETMGSRSQILAGGEEEALWRQFDTIGHTTEEGTVLARVIAPVTELPRLVENGQKAAGEIDTQVSVRAHMGHGHALLRWHEPPTGEAVRLLRDLRRQAEACGSNLVIWRGPAEVRSQIDAWGDVGEGVGLMRRIKAQFDPNGTLNPGRFVRGI